MTTTPAIGARPELWRRGPHKHTARKWHGPDGTYLKCEECGWGTGCDGTIREKEDRFREHRSGMGEVVKPKRVPPMRDRLATAEQERDAALAVLQEVREAQSLGAALAAVYRHDNPAAVPPEGGQHA